MQCSLGEHPYANEPLWAHARTLGVIDIFVVVAGNQ